MTDTTHVYMSSLYDGYPIAAFTSRADAERYAALDAGRGHVVTVPVQAGPTEPRIILAMAWRPDRDVIQWTYPAHPWDEPPTCVLETEVSGIVVRGTNHDEVRSLFDEWCPADGASHPDNG